MSPAPESLSVEILVIGAGVLGLCTAVELTRRGHDVAVLDPGGANASSIAAGMIAPALESAIDDVSPERAALLRRAAGLWPDFAAETGVRLWDSGAEWRGEGGEQIADRLSALGFQFRREGDRVYAAEDRRVEAEAALAILAERLPRPLIVGRAERLAPEAGGWRVDHGSGVVLARNLVLATGAARAVPGAPEPVTAGIAAVTPIRGQIGRTRVLSPPGVARGRGAYVASGTEMSHIGATMEVGRRDLAPDMEVGRTLTEAASRLLGEPVDPRAVDWRVGVRGATADGLPLAGRAGVPGLFLALAPRRNGWLLGPLVGRIVADAVEGGAPLPDAAALDPLRPL